MGKKSRFFLQAGGTKARVPISRLPVSRLVMIFLRFRRTHLQSSGWKAHGHNRNPAYDQVILHVALYHQPRHGVFNTLENQIPELELAPHLKALKPQSQKQSKERLKRIEQLPGRCGVWIRENDPLLLKNLLGHAAEQRMQNKMRQLHQKW